MAGRSSSCSALPPVAGATPSKSGRTTGRTREEAPKRRNFLEGLLNDDLQQLTQWHGTRSALEQKNFLKSVDMLYKDFTALDQGQGGRAPKLAPSQKQVRQEQRSAEAAFEAAVAAESDPLARPSTPPMRGMAQSRSEGSIPSKPIDVFAHNKKKGIRSQSGREDNSLARWLEAQSISSRTTATNQTRQTTFSQMSRTSAGSGSICSEPCTQNQAVFRQHKRALALNRANWAAADQNSACYLKDGLGIGIPDEARLHTTNKEFFGSATIGATVPKGLYEGVISENKQKHVEQWLESAPVEKKEQLGGMLRSLQFLRRQRAMGTKSLAGNDLDLAENRRLFHPSVQKPVFSSAMSNYSRVPIGTGAGYIDPNVKAQRQEMPAQTAPPPSPGVSELGSIRLGSPRSLATPLVGGRDLPLMNVPAPPPGMHGR